MGVNGRISRIGAGPGDGETDGVLVTGEDRARELADRLEADGGGEDDVGGGVVTGGGVGGD